MRIPSLTVTAAVAVLLAAAVAVGVQETQPSGTGTPDVEADTLVPLVIEAHENADRGPLQPIPISHKFHVQQVGLECAYCHTGTERSEVAIIPPLEVCMGCHRNVARDLEPIQEMAEYWNADQPVPWERVYKVPEFVQFLHRPHMRNEIECQECHGPVEEMHRVYEVEEYTMGWCLDCHMGETEERDFATDVLLTERFPPPEMPEGTEEPGLYPVRISSGYAEQRAPIDCVTCHY